MITKANLAKIYLSFSLFISFNYWLLKGKVCTSQVSVMFQYHWHIVRMVRKHQSSADESYRDGLTKKAAHLWVENTKIGAYAISHLKSDNEGEPGKIGLSFSLFISFNYWLLKGKVCTSQVSVMFQYHWYIVKMVRKNQSSSWQVIKRWPY